MHHFLKTHIKEQIYLTDKTVEKDNEFNSWLEKKDIIISLNKKDLLSVEELNFLDGNYKMEKEKKFQINKISCINDDTNQDDIKELLNDLSGKVGEL